MNYRETMRAEMQPDMYDGPKCDQMRPRWYAGAEGDMGDGDHIDVLTLAAATFPPGTKVTVSVPECPNCTVPADINFDPATGKTGPCQCGFDWATWAADQYS